MAGEGRLVDVEELVDVAGGDGERAAGGEPGDGGVQRRGERDEAQPGAVGDPQPVGRVAEQAAALRPPSGTGSPSRANPVDEGDGARLVGGEVDAGRSPGTGDSSTTSSGRSPTSSTPTSTARSSWYQTSGPNSSSRSASVPG